MYFFPLQKKFTIHDMKNQFDIFFHHYFYAIMFIIHGDMSEYNILLNNNFYYP